MSRALGGALLLASLPLAASAPPASLTTHIYKTVGELPLRADVFRPDDRGGRPIVLWVHGGGLVHGHRRGLPEDQRRLYLQSGHVVVCIDYRLAPETKLPGILEDLGDAWAWVRGHATEIGGDPERIAVVGQSAGGHLALAAGQRLHPAPRAIVSFDTAVPVAQAHQMADTMGKAGVPHRVRTLPGRDHAFDLAEGALHERDVAETFGDTLVFLSRWLGSPPPLAASSAPSGRLERLHALVEANVQAVHAYQVLLARKSAKGDPACWSADLNDAALKSLEAHQASLLREDVAAVRAWVEGLPSSFDPARNLDPLRKAALPMAFNLPVSLITADLAARAASPDPVGIRALANLYQTIFEVDRDGDRLQELFSFYIALGLPASVAPGARRAAMPTSSRGARRSHRVRAPHLSVRAHPSSRSRGARSGTGARSISTCTAPTRTSRLSIGSARPSGRRGRRSTGSTTWKIPRRTRRDRWSATRRPLGRRG